MLYVQFLCLKNIRVFLQTCRTVFKMADQDLFEPNDLFEVKDFGKVRSCKVIVLALLLNVLNVLTIFSFDGNVG